MYSERLGSSTVRVFLTQREAREAGIATGEQPAASGMEFIRRLTEKALGDIALRQSSHINVEVIPSRDRGCVIYIHAEEPQLYLITVDTIDRLRMVCGILSKNGLADKKAQLYADDSLIRLTVRLPSEDCAAAERIRSIASLVPADETVLCHIAERSRLILEKEAIETVSRLLKA